MTVYFIESGRRIKIGFTTNLKSRVMQLQTSASVRLKLLGAVDGDRKLERELHQQLEKHRTSGEWFKRRADVLALVNQTIETYPPAPADRPKPPHVPVYQPDEGELYTDQIIRLIDDFGTDVKALKTFVESRKERIDPLPFCRRHKIKAAYKVATDKYLSEIMRTASRDNQARQVAMDDIKRRCDWVKSIVVAQVGA